MKLGCTHFDGLAAAPYVRVTVTPQDDFKLIDRLLRDGKKVIPVLRFRPGKKQADSFPSPVLLRSFIETLATRYHGDFEYVFVGSEQNDSLQWSGTPGEYETLVNLIRDEYTSRDSSVLIGDGGIQGYAIDKRKAVVFEGAWRGVDVVNFHHFQDLASLDRVIDYIRTKTDKPLVCSACGVKKSTGKKTTMTAKIQAMKSRGVELLIWFAGDGDDTNTNIWTLPKYLREFNANYAAIEQGVTL